MEGKQIYLPFMAIYLQERNDSEKPDVSFFNFYMIKKTKNESSSDLKTFELIFFGCSLRF